MGRKNITTSNANINKKTFRIYIYLFLKRMFDIIISLVGIIVLSPLFLILAVAIKIDSDGPVFFVHKRIGYKGKKLNVYKFRTMIANAEELLKTLTPEQKREFKQSFKLDNDFRITRVGKFLRKTSLDELPQLLNVLIGNMALVGPRPVIEVELSKYGKYKDKFLSVKPGLTGYWQANGRSNTTYDERVAMDMYYIDHMFITLDLLIMIQTIGAVIRKEGAK